jgi:hypothetical protein
MPDDNHIIMSKGHPMIASSCIWVALWLTQAPPDNNSELVQRWRAVCQQQAEMYVVGFKNTDSPRFQRLRTPIFSHATPARGNDIGSVFLWVDEQQRPMVVADIFAWSLNNDPKRQVVHECHSLAPAPLDVKLGDRRLWKPQQAGLQWRALPDAPIPMGMKAQRWRQARDLVQQFSANSVDEKGGRWELRVLPQPVHQYEAGSGETRQTGAMFAVCQGTDPELWILLEARRDGDKDRWFFACATFTDYALQVRHQDKDVWTHAKYVQGTNDAPHWVEGVFSNITAPELAKSSQK